MRFHFKHRQDLSRPFVQKDGMYARVLTAVASLLTILGMCLWYIWRKRRETTLPGRIPEFSQRRKDVRNPEEALREKYKTNLVRSYDGRNAAAVLIGEGGAYEATMLSEARQWIDVFLRRLGRQTVHNSQCLPEKTLEAIHGVAVMQASKYQQEEVSVVQEGNVWLVLIRIVKGRDMSTVAREAIIDVISTVAAKVSPVSREDVSQVVDNVMSGLPACDKMGLTT